MPTHRAAFGPTGWSPAGSTNGKPAAGVWEKELRRPAKGDAFTLLRLDAGAAFEPAAGAADRLFVIEGEVQLAQAGNGDAGRVCRRGAYLELPQSDSTLSSTGASMMMLVQGPHLGDSAEDVFSPLNWLHVAPGLWTLPLLRESLDGDLTERIAGVAYIEPGSSAGRHHHRTAHLFLFLDGDAEDEMVHPDGRREVAQRTAGDFVDYPYPIEHSTFSRGGCTILFIHEPISCLEP